MTHHTKQLAEFLEADGLKPCPFCDGKPEIMEYTSISFGAQWQVECQNIDCTVEVSSLAATSKEWAIKSWNTRAITPALTALLADYKKAVEALRKYGNHTNHCSVMSTISPCDCGWAKLKKSLSTSKKWQSILTTKGE